MRSLPAPLAAAQKAPSRIPYLQITVKDRLAGVRRLRWTNWYTGAEPNEGHASVVADDGSLIRIRFDSNTLYRSRVTSPGSGSTYSSWTNWGTYRASVGALAKDTNGKLWCFAVSNATPTQVWAATSTDHGATWTSFTLQFTRAVTITHIAAAANPAGTDVVVVTNGGAGGDNPVAVRYSGSWGSQIAAGADLTITGLAVFRSNDWNVIVTGTDGDGNNYVRRRIFGAGYSAAVDTWSASKVDIHQATAGSNINLTRPFAARPDTNRVTFRQQYTGTVSYDRLARTQQPALADFIDDLWREPVPFEITAPYGAALSYDADDAYLTTARHVYHATITTTDLDLTADVITARIHDRPTSPILSEIVLDNSKGTYDSPGAGAVAALTKGADVTIAPGYRTTSGDQASSGGPAYNIVAFDHEYAPNRATLTIVLGSPWTHLARHRFPRAIVIAEAVLNVFQQLRYIAARVGYALTSVGGSSQSANLQPPLTITPGTSALTAFRRALERIPDHPWTAGDDLKITEPLAADAADATYAWPIGAADQRIEQASYRSALKDANHVQVFADDAASIVAEDLDFAEIDLLYSAPLQRHDPYVSAGADATDRATREQRQQLIRTTRNDEIVAPVHAGIEVNDIISVSDSRAGLTSANRRVLALDLDYHRGPRKVRYHHTIKLGAP